MRNLEWTSRRSDGYGSIHMVDALGKPSLRWRLMRSYAFALDRDVQLDERFVSAVSERVAWLAPKGT